MTVFIVIYLVVMCVSAVAIGYWAYVHGEEEDFSDEKMTQWVICAVLWLPYLMILWGVIWGMARKERK